MGSSNRNRAEISNDCNQRLPRSLGRYLLAVFWIWTIEHRRVRPGEVSDRLDVQPASVTEMFDKLDRAGLVNYKKHEGAVLADEGAHAARELASRQCTVRTFFAERVDTELTAEEAYRIGYTLPETAIERLRETVYPACETACQVPGRTASTCPLKP